MNSRNTVCIHRIREIAQNEGWNRSAPSQRMLSAAGIAGLNGRQNDWLAGQGVAAVHLPQMLPGWLQYQHAPDSALREVEKYLDAHAMPCV